MSQYFNLTRFGRLVRKHTAESWKTYALSAAVLLGGLLLLLGFFTYVPYRPLNGNEQAILFELLLLGAGCLFASTVFGQFGAGRQAALALTLPASQLEKYALAWLVSLPLFVVVFTAAFYLADWLVMHFVSPAVGPLLPLLGGKEIPGLRLFLALHGLALWGSIFFPRLAFIKTASLGLGGALLVGILNFKLLNHWVDGKLGMAIPFNAASINGAGPLLLPHAQEKWLLLLPLALAALLWAAAYARLTEKQL
ncbi:MAG: hypothetical protein ACRYG7_51375 [Janthinobacterium lividum]